MHRGLKKWLEVVFRALFKDLGNAFLIGQQEDGESCGICVINAIEHAMFGVPLFTDEDRYALRVRYFVEVVKYLLDNVSVFLGARNNRTDTFFSLLHLHVKGTLNLWTYRVWEPMRCFQFRRGREMGW